MARTYGGGYGGKKSVTVFPQLVTLLLAVCNNKTKGANYWDVETFLLGIPSQPRRMTVNEHIGGLPSRRMRMLGNDIGYQLVSQFGFTGFVCWI